MTPTPEELADWITNHIAESNSDPMLRAVALELQRLQKVEHDVKFWHEQAIIRIQDFMQDQREEFEAIMKANKGGQLMILPDQNCYTLPNGDCVGTGGCMHDSLVHVEWAKAEATAVEACGGTVYLQGKKEEPGK